MLEESKLPVLETPRSTNLRAGGPVNHVPNADGEKETFHQVMPIQWILIYLFSVLLSLLFARVVYLAIQWYKGARSPAAISKKRWGRVGVRYVKAVMDALDDAELDVEDAANPQRWDAPGMTEIWRKLNTDVAGLRWGHNRFVVRLAVAIALRLKMKFPRYGVAKSPAMNSALMRYCDSIRKELKAGPDNGGFRDLRTAPFLKAAQLAVQCYYIPTAWEAATTTLADDQEVRDLIIDRSEAPMGLWGYIKFQFFGIVPSEAPLEC